MKDKMIDNPVLRCKKKKCGKILAKGIIKVGIVEIKCKKCGTYNIFQMGNFEPIKIPKEIE